MVIEGPTRAGAPLHLILMKKGEFGGESQEQLWL